MKSFYAMAKSHARADEPEHETNFFRHICILQMDIMVKSIPATL